MAQDNRAFHRMLTEDVAVEQRRDDGRRQGSGPEKHNLDEARSKGKRLG